jgi:hypothetical protein
MPDGVIPVPPDGIRPGQLGAVLLGRVIIGDIAATLIDLSVRGMLAVEEHDEGDQDGWLLRPEATAQQRDTLLSYERTLLSAASDGARPATIQSLTPRMPQVLARAREEIAHDAVSNGWLRRFHHGQRTDAGERLAMRIRRFQRDLRKLATDQGQDALAGRLLPFTLHFGMVERDQLTLVKFAHAWVAALASIPGWHQPDPARPRFDEPDAVAKPTIDEQIMDPYVGMGVWLTGWGT